MRQFLILLSVLTVSEHDIVDQVNKQLGGQQEVVLPDKSRVDILTDRYAIEVDSAKRWHQAIGQATFYAIMTNRKPAIILYDVEKRFYLRCLLVCEKYDIKLWTYDDFILGAE